MYQELARVAELSATTYWPVPDRFGGHGARATQTVLANLKAVGWQSDGNALSLPGQDPETPLQILLDWPDCLDQPIFRGQVAAEAAALKLLATSHLPLRRTIRLLSTHDGIDSGDSLIWRVGSEAEAGEGGLLFLLIKGEHGNLIRLPESGLFNQAKNALNNAGLRPRLYLRTGSVMDGLGYLAPGQPERSRPEMACAIQAYASLVYGLAGYGIMAFQFDLDF